MMIIIQLFLLKIKNLILPVIQLFGRWRKRYGYYPKELDKMTLAINDLQEEFVENDSEIETVARDSIAETIIYILDFFNINIDIEDA